MKMFNDNPQTNYEGPALKIHKLLNRAYVELNNEFFEGELPDVMFTMTRKKNARGFHRNESFTDGKENFINEIGMHPDDFVSRDNIKVLSTVLHELVHLWQYYNGKPGKNGYHNKQWVKKMEEVGLEPDNFRGGKTGTKVSHNIIDGGMFADYAKTAVNWFILPWGAVTFNGAKSSRKTIYKAVCDCSSKQTAYGVSGMAIACGHCGEWFEEQ